MALKPLYKSVIDLSHTSLNGIASGTYWYSAVIDNVINLDLIHRLYVALTASGAAQSDAAANIWLSGSPDGINFAGGVPSTGPGTAYTPLDGQQNGMIPLSPLPMQATAQRQFATEYDIVQQIPPRQFIIVVQPVIGVNLHTSGNIVNLIPAQIQDTP